MKSALLYLVLGVLIAIALQVAPREARAGATCGAGTSVLCEATSEKGCTNQFGQAVPCPMNIWPPAIPIPPKCDAAHLGNCTMTGDQCTNMAGLGGEYQIRQASDGTPFCVPARKPPSCPNIPIDNPAFASPDCHVYPLRPRNSADPNDKTGTLGVADAGFVPPTTPLHYAVHFENLATATAPAQVVVITDQLDVAKLDPDTFALGPMTVGDNITIVPGSGLQSFRAGMDLRPDRDLLLVVTATLDKSNGIASWRFESIDPATGQLTGDPDAGFLPPNVAAPAGEGTVVFTIMPRTTLATSTAIRNQALVVFDTNAPIATPTWLNTIDKDAPVTHVLPLAATQSAATFPVQWAGIDAGAGIRDFSIYVSDNGAAFMPWLDHTTAVSASFTGTAGHSYGFFALGTDLVGNAEATKIAAETATQVVAGAACAADISSRLQLTRSGFAYNLATQRFVQTVTLRNVSSTSIGGPISLVLDGLSETVTLVNATATTACAMPAGSPFVNWASTLAPGASASIVLQFANPSRAGITYVTRVLAGSAGR